MMLRSGAAGWAACSGNMYFSPSPQLLQQVICLGTGLLLGLLYDMLFPLRRLCRSHPVMLAAVDIFFFALALPAAVISLYLCCELVVRPGYLMSMALGALLYRFGPSLLLRSFFHKKRKDK